MSIDWFEISRGRAVAEKEFSEMKADHVSKSELRAWCEGEIEYQNELIGIEEGEEDVEECEIFKIILNRFCKKEEV